MEEIKLINQPKYKDGINRIAFRISQQEKKVLCFSSLNSQEGKTTTAYYVAEALSIMHKKVCLIDVDMIQKKELDFDKTLNSFLEDQNSLEQILVKKDNIHYIKSSEDSNSVSLLSSVRYKLLLQELKEKYDYILLDAPSLEPNIDALLVAKESDAVILVIEGGKNKKGELERALLRLKNNNINLLGAILNKYFIDKNIF